MEIKREKANLQDTDWSLILSSAKSYLEARGKENRQVKYMYHWIDTCANFADAVSCYDKIESMYKKQEINKDDYTALNTIMCQMVTTGQFNEGKTTVEIDEKMTHSFHRRIWSETNIGKVMQFRNCVTDMYMLDFLTLEEYIDLNNEVDRYIQYQLTNGR